MMNHNQRNGRNLRKWSAKLDGRKALFSVCVAVLLSLGFSGLSRAVTITNNGMKGVTLSDLTLFQNPDGSGKSQVVLLGNFAGDDTPLPAGGGSTAINGVRNAITGVITPLISFQSFDISFPDARGNEHEYRIKRTNMIGNIFATFATDSSVPLFIDVLADIMVDENVSFSIVGGLNADLSDLFFSTTPFTFDINGNRVGATGFNGLVSSGPSISVQVPEPATLLLVAIGAVFLLGRRRRGAIGIIQRR